MRAESGSLWIFPIVFQTDGHRLCSPLSSSLFTQALGSCLRYLLLPHPNTPPSTHLFIRRRQIPGGSTCWYVIRRFMWVIQAQMRRASYLNSCISTPHFVTAAIVVLPSVRSFHPENRKKTFGSWFFFPSFVYKDTRCKEFKLWLPDSARTFNRRSVRQTNVFISERVELYVSPGHKSATFGIKFDYEIEALFHLNLKEGANFCPQLISFNRRPINLNKIQTCFLSYRIPTSCWRTNRVSGSFRVEKCKEMWFSGCNKVTCERSDSDFCMQNVKCRNVSCFYVNKTLNTIDFYIM